MPLSKNSILILKSIFINLLVALGYFVTAKIGQSLAHDADLITLVWPPSGIALGALLLWGFKVIPGIFLGAVLSRFVPGEIPLLATYIAIGNTLGATTSAYLLSKFKFGSGLYSARQVLLFAVFGAVLSPAISAVLGTSSLVLNGAGTWGSFGGVWFTWWLGDLIGILLFTPFMLAWWSPWQASPRQQILESIFITLLISVTSLVIFFPQFHNISLYPIEYLLFPLLLWGVFRFGQRGSTLATLIVAAIAIWATAVGYGPFAGSSSLHTDFISLELFLVVLSLTSVLISSIIEEKLTAQRDLHNEEQKFRDLIEYSSDVFTIIDLEANILYTSPSITKNLGYTPEEIQGTNVFTYVDPRDKDRLLGLFSDILKVPHKTIHATYRMLTKQGESRWIEGTGTNLLDEPGVKGVAVSYRDIDAQKKLDLVKSEFVTLAAHQLRTPLTTMKWYTESLRTHLKNDQHSAKYLEAIYLSILKMNNFANLMLDVTKVEIGKFISEKEEIKLSTLLDPIINDLQLEAQQQKITLQVIYPKPLPKIIANPKSIHIIIQNLLDNSIRYTLSGGKVTLSVKIVDHQLNLVVKDTGIGIPSSEQPKIFTKLFRASTGYKVSPDGTGLGLYLVKTLVEKERGKIWFDSSEGEGTTFYVQLPIKLPKRS